MLSLSTDKKNHSLTWLGLALLLVILFLSVGSAVKYTAIFDVINKTALTYFTHHHTRPTDIFFISSTLLCEAPYYYVVAAALLVWLSLYRHWLLAIHFLMTMAIVYYTSPFLKKVFEIARPFEGVVNIGYAFPSGHTFLAFAAFGFWSVVFTQHLTGKTKYMVMFVYNLPAIIIGLSRLYLGVHWATDVVGGLLAAGMIICLSFSIYPQHLSAPIKPDKWFWVLISVAFLIVGYLISIYFSDNFYFYEQIYHSLQ